MSRFRQCQCRWCGLDRLSIAGRGGCPVDDDMRLALYVFSRSNGAHWKKRLRELWARGTEAAAGYPALRGLARWLGSGRLDNITSSLLEHWFETNHRGGRA